MINNYFDKIYVLNLEKEKERMLNISNNLNKMNILFERFDAFGENNIEVQNSFNKIKNDDSALIKSIGATGCLFSHRAIINDAIKNNYSNILIFEDDVLFDNNFLEKIKYIRLIPNNWSLLYLGASQHDWSNFKPKKFYYDALKTDGTFAYAIKRNAFKEILNLSSDLKHPIDWYLRKYQEKNTDKCFVIYPNICIADVTSSSIRSPRDQVQHSQKMRWNLNNFNFKKKLEILWCKLDKSNFTASNVDSLSFEKTSDANITLLQHNINNAHPGGWLTSVLKNEYKPNNIIENYLNKNNTPDLIICDNLCAFKNEPWDKFNIPLFSILVDQHSKVDEEQVSIAIKYNFNLFHRYKFNLFHRDLSKKIKTFYLPHSVNTNLYKNLNLKKEIDLLQTGATSSVYTLRNFIKNFNFKNINYKFTDRPSDTSIEKWPIGKDYIDLINKSTFTVACGSKYNYPVLKYFEIPACNSIIYGSYSDELRSLGFLKNVNFIEANTKNPEEHIKLLLKNKELINNLSLNGLKLINEKHSNLIRINQMYNIIRENI